MPPKSAAHARLQSFTLLACQHFRISALQEGVLRSSLSEGSILLEKELQRERPDRSCPVRAVCAELRVAGTVLTPAVMMVMVVMAVVVPTVVRAVPRVGGVGAGG